MDFCRYLSPLLEELDVESVVAVDVVEVVVAMAVVVVTGTATLEIAEAAERPANPKTDKTCIFRDPEEDQPFENPRKFPGSAQPGAQ